MKSKNRTRIRVIVLAGIVSCLALSVWAFGIEPNQLVIHEQTITVAHWPNGLRLKLAVLADIHAGSPFINVDKLHQVVASTNECKADLVVLLGDFMVKKGWPNNRMEPQLIASALRDLHAPLGVYAVLGNHDWWYDGNKVRGSLESVGIKVLENEVLSFKCEGKSLWLAGLADAWTRPQNISGTLEQIPFGETTIVLSHNPDVFPATPSTVSIVLAGHTHGGQVNLPLLGRMIVPSHYGQRYAAGLVEENGKRLFVTTGIGTSIIPVRFRVPPEIAIVTLTSQ